MTFDHRFVQIARASSMQKMVGSLYARAGIVSQVPRTDVAGDEIRLAADQERAAHRLILPRQLWGSIPARPDR
jgi:hypothetical protein